ncbi:MAG: hypothetical protein HQL50_15175, partial [Magnetococcales bacterium]|nr:hypothetical protein [Magnetococcales bacterium]
LTGSHEALLDAVRSGQNITIGLHEGSYEESIPLPSVALSNGIAYGVQPFHTSAAATLENQRKMFQDGSWGARWPYGVILMYASDNRHGFFRHSFTGDSIHANSELPTDPGSKGRYEYYRWIADGSQWREVCNSSSPMEAREDLVECVKKGQPIKVRFELMGITYILQSTINFVGSPVPTDVSIRSMPMMFWQEEKPNVYFCVEFTAGVSGEVSMMSRVQFVSGSDEGPRYGIQHFLVKSDVTWLTRDLA